jgi:hypothetical protein
MRSHSVPNVWTSMCGAQGCRCQSWSARQANATRCWHAVQDRTPRGWWKKGLASLDVICTEQLGGGFFRRIPIEHMDTTCGPGKSDSSANTRGRSLNCSCPEVGNHPPRQFDCLADSSSDRPCYAMQCRTAETSLMDIPKGVEAQAVPVGRG